jgi:hypothetical protein
MDTMAWMPWIFFFIREASLQKPGAGFKLALFWALQVFAGYPQILFYTLTGGLCYGMFLKGPRFLPKLIPSLAGGFLLSACQWIPSLEYFSLHAARMPAVAGNPDFTLPLENLKTFFSFTALGRGAEPDYALSPTFFYFNFYSGLIPLGLLGLGFARWKSIGGQTRFFLAGFLFAGLWAFGLFSAFVSAFHLSLPSFLEPGKVWVLADLLELCAVGLILEDLFPKPGLWKTPLLILAVLDLLLPVWKHPLETNLLPKDSFLQTEAEKIKSNLGTGRVLILPDSKEHARLYTPSAAPGNQPLFKHFIPNSNLLASIPSANFYGSTWPSWGSMDAQLYFQYSFPYQNRALLDLLGVDLLLLTEGKMPAGFEKIRTDGNWTLWRNPTSLGGVFFFQGEPENGSLKETFLSFTGGKSVPSRTLFLDPRPVSSAPRRSLSPRVSARNRYPLPENKKGTLVISQNALPGWRAWVDGKPVPLLLADGLFQGLTIPAGSRQAAVAYEPASFRLGLFVSLLAWAGLGGWGLRRKLVCN